VRAWETIHQLNIGHPDQRLRRSDSSNDASNKDQVSKSCGDHLLGILSSGNILENIGVSMIMQKSNHIGVITTDRAEIRVTMSLAVDRRLRDCFMDGRSSSTPLKPELHPA
jgi:hypothetical protein